MPFLQGSLNNSTNATTGQAPNELAYGFKVRDSLNMLADLPVEDLRRLRNIRRKEAKEAVAFANATMKARYDSNHKPISLKEGSQVYLRLHRGYKIPGLDNRKLSHQRVGPFTVKKAVGPLAYELDLPATMRIHPVISIAHLEPLPSEEDPFDRPWPENPPPVSAVDDDAPEYEIERLLGKRISGRRLQYLVKWKGYSHYWNRWYDVDDLRKAQRLINEYKDHHAARPQGRRGRLLPQASTSQQEVSPSFPPPSSPPKRKPGRPRKAVTTAAPLAAPLAATPAATPAPASAAGGVAPPVRRRGRPRKHP